jgi:cytochrome c556
MPRKFLGSLAAAASLATAASALAADPTHDHARPMQAATPMADMRQDVQFPPELKAHTLANMRDHLLTLQRIQEALAKGAFDSAAELAENRLGLSSLQAHGAHEVAKFMPRGMQDIGTSMHKSASRFALEAQTAGASGDLKGPLAALATVTQQCVACHAAYRLK